MYFGVAIFYYHNADVGDLTTRLGVEWRLTQNDVDFVAASFVRKVADVEEVRAYLAEQMAKHWPADHPPPHIISKIENEEGEGLSGTFGNPRYTDPRVFALNSTIANTNIVWHGGKLLALEEAHAPFSLDPKSLMPVGPKDGGYETFGDKLIGPFTAHPKFDPETGEMIFFGYSATGRFTKEISIQAVTEDGTVTRAEMLEGPFPSMIHDFAVTKNWIVVPVFPLTSSMELSLQDARAALGAREAA